jgi:hypothetical protein
MMMDDLDQALRMLANAPAHPGLSSIDEAVFGRIAARNAAVVSGRVALVAGVGAVLMGLAGAGLPSAPALAAPALSPFGAADPLAPSTLLGDGH